MTTPLAPLVPSGAVLGDEVYARLGEAIRARYAEGLIQRVYPYAAMPADDRTGRIAALVAGIKAG